MQYNNDKDTALKEDDLPKLPTTTTRMLRGWQWQQEGQLARAGNENEEAAPPMTTRRTICLGWQQGEQGWYVGVVDNLEEDVAQGLVSKMRMTHWHRQQVGLPGPEKRRMLQQQQ